MTTHPRSPIRGRRFRLGVSLLLLCLWSGSLHGADGDAEFTFSADPGALVFLYSSFATNTGVERTFSLFGDGRLEYRLLVHSGEQASAITHRAETSYLEYLEMEGILQLAIDHNLMETTSRAIREEVLRINYGNPPLEIDCGYSTVEIYLTEFSRGGDIRSPAVNKITIFCPILQARNYGLPEHEGFRLLDERLTALRDQAKKRSGDATDEEGGNL